MHHLLADVLIQYFLLKYWSFLIITNSIVHLNLQLTDKFINGGHEWWSRQQGYKKTRRHSPVRRREKTRQVLAKTLYRPPQQTATVEARKDRRGRYLAVKWALLFRFHVSLFLVHAKALVISRNLGGRVEARGLNLPVLGSKTEGEIKLEIWPVDYLQIHFFWSIFPEDETFISY